jgi:CBS-domain-containing membrane protein
MNIAFFLTPKNTVVWLRDRSTVRQATEKMETHRYTAIPMVDDDGRYAGTITEGDLLWWMKRSQGPWRELAEHTRVLDVPRRVDNQPVRMDAEMDRLVALATEQNFVPVVDDRGVFVGIVRRKTIIEYLAGICVARARASKGSVRGVRDPQEGPGFDTKRLESPGAQPVP